MGTEFSRQNIWKRVEKPRRDTIIEELFQGVTITYPNLSVRNIVERLRVSNIITVWNGHTYVEILRKMGISNDKIYNLTTYDALNDHYLCLKLERIATDNCTFSLDLGYHNKKRRLLSLEETHDIICWEDHGPEVIHNPIKDVEMTKCLYKCLMNNI